MPYQFDSSEREASILDTRNFSPEMKTTKKVIQMEKTDDNPSVPTVDSLATALRILDLFTYEEPELSLKQLSEKTGLYKSRIHRLCGTLVTSGFLLRTPASSYRLGPKLMTLGKIYENTNSLVSLARPIMRNLAAETGESVALFRLIAKMAFCLAREYGRSRLVFAIQEGDSMDLYASAAGRVLLAYTSQELQDEILNVPQFNRFTALTITDPERIKNELVALKKRGYAVNRGERELEVAAIAAPIFDHKHQVESCLAVVGPVQRFALDNEESIAFKLLAATREISVLLGASEQFLRRHGRNYS